MLESCRRKLQQIGRSLGLGLSPVFQNIASTASSNTYATDELLASNKLQGDEPSWSEYHRWYGPFHEDTCLGQTHVSRIDAMTAAFGESPPGCLLMPKGVTVSGTKMIYEYDAGMVCTLDKWLSRHPSGLQQHDPKQLARTLVDVLRIMQHGVRALPIIAADFAVLLDPKTGTTTFAYWALHKCQLVANSTDKGMWMESELTGTPDLWLSGTLFNSSDDELFRDAGLKHTTALLMQLLHVAVTGKSMAGYTAKDQARCLREFQYNEDMPSCPLVHSRCWQSFIELCISTDREQRLDVDQLAAHYAVMAKDAQEMFLARLVVTLGGIMLSKPDTLGQQEAKQQLVKLVNRTCVRHLATTRAIKEQLGGGLHRTLAFTKPDDYRSPWSRMCGGDWEYGIGEHMCVAIACAVRDSNRWQAKCVQQYPDSLKGPGGGAVDPLEVVAKLILPRFTKDYGSYYQSAGDIGAVSAACTEGLAVALQDMLRRNADVVGPYAETLEGFYKLEPKETQKHAWFDHLRDVRAPVSLQEALAVLPEMHVECAPAYRHVPRNHSEQLEALDSLPLAIPLPTDTGADVAADVNLHLPASDDHLLQRQQQFQREDSLPYAPQQDIAASGCSNPLTADCMGQHALSADELDVCGLVPVVKDPLLRCRGLSVEVPDLKQLRCLAAQEALLPCPRVLARAIATLYHVDPQQAGLEYAARQCRGLLFAAIAQGFGGPAVLRLITASIHVGLQIGEHPASCDHPDSLLRLALEGFGRLHKGLRLPYQFDQWQQDNLLAHIVWATLYERGAAAAADLCVAWVGEGHANTARMICASLSEGKYRYALQQLQGYRWWWRRLWLTPDFIRDVCHQAVMEARGVNHSGCVDLGLLPSYGVMDDAPGGPCAPAGQYLRVEDPIRWMEYPVDTVVVPHLTSQWELPHHGMPQPEGENDEDGGGGGDAESMRQDGEDHHGDHDGSVACGQEAVSLALCVSKSPLKRSTAGMMDVDDEQTYSPAKRSRGMTVCMT